MRKNISALQNILIYVQIRKHSSPVADSVHRYRLGYCMSMNTDFKGRVSTHRTQCHIYASVNSVNICSDNDLSPIRHQAIILTNTG